MDAIRVAALLVTLALSPAPAHPAQLGPAAYSGTGVWIDRYDFARLEDAETVTAELAAHGVRTLYVETASWRVSKRVDVVAPRQTQELITAAHANGMKVVAWYLPGLKDLRTDLRRVRAALAFRTLDGQAFDSFALDIEANLVNPVPRRNAALLRLSRMIRSATGPGYELGAIVPDERSTSSGNVLWPSFPYAEAAKYYDVFLPMAYSTFNRARGAARVYRYTVSNVRFVREATGRPVHLIGGLTDSMSAQEQAAVSLAARDAGAIGASLYKYRLFDEGSWAALDVFDLAQP
ncbi:MAG TPA: hypothetical protein VH247_07865 [Thermoleophilaceae bacterium]|jgi:hypothetical protein|nr:hypothetical protein [Thermoleophilaceae bacterium]